MALDPNAMAALIKSNIEAITNYPAAGESPVFVDDRIVQAICKGITDHFKAALQVAATGSGSGTDSHGDAVTVTVTTNSTTVT